MPDAPALDVAESMTFAELTRRSSFWLLLVGSAASIGSIASVNFLMKFVFEEQGFTSQAARDQIWSTASFTALVAAIGGRIVVGWLADRMSRKVVMVVTYSQVAIAIPLLFLVTPETPQFAYLFGAVFGFAMGADYMLIPLMAADAFGLRSLGRAMSAIVPGDTITQYLVAQHDRQAANRVGRLRQRALGGVRNRRGGRHRDRAAAGRRARAGLRRRRLLRRALSTLRSRPVI